MMAPHTTVVFLGALWALGVASGAPADAGFAANLALVERGTTTRVSVSSDEVQANKGGADFGPVVSSSGRYVAFASGATNLVAHDTNGSSDVFVRDRRTGTTKRVSVSTEGRQGNRTSFGPAISDDGRYVVFESNAKLVPTDTNNFTDVYLRDRVAKATRLISVGRNGRQGNNDTSYRPAISSDGRFVAFRSAASNMVADDTNRAYDVFVRDRVADVTRRVSVGPNGRQSDRDSGEPAISADGRHVTYQSEATNLVRKDTNGAFDVFVRDRVAKVTRRVSVGDDEAQGDGNSFNPAISASGQYIAFTSAATGLVADDTNNRVDVFVRDRVAGVTLRVSRGEGGSQGNRFSGQPTISADGRYVAFTSHATDLVVMDSNESADVFLRDLLAEVTILISANRRGLPARKDSYRPAISGNGEFVGFTSDADNLVAGDTNNTADIFMRKW